MRLHPISQTSSESLEREVLHKPRISREIPENNWTQQRSSMHIIVQVNSVLGGRLNMSTLVNPYIPLPGDLRAGQNPAAPESVHLEVPTLLEYRGEEDPDVDFIPKTITGFGAGALIVGLCLDLAET